MTLVRRAYEDWFGNVYLARAYCKSCDGYAIIRDSTFQCCGADAPDTEKVQRQICPAQARRKTPSLAVRNRVLVEQSNRCLYCRNEFGGFVFRGAHPIQVKLVWDHFVPYCYTFNSRSTNFVAACDLCNSIKSGKVFDTIQEAQEYVQTKRAAKGIQDMPQLPKILPSQT